MCDVGGGGGTSREQALSYSGTYGREFFNAANPAIFNVENASGPILWISGADDRNTPCAKLSSFLMQVNCNTHTHARTHVRTHTHTHTHAHIHTNAHAHMHTQGKKEGQSEITRIP